MWCDHLTCMCEIAVQLGHIGPLIAKQQAKEPRQDVTSFSVREKRLPQLSVFFEIFPLSAGTDVKQLSKWKA